MSLLHKFFLGLAPLGIGSEDGITTEFLLLVICSVLLSLVGSLNISSVGKNKEATITCISITLVQLMLFLYFCPLP